MVRLRQLKAGDWLMSVSGIKADSVSSLPSEKLQGPLMPTCVCISNQNRRVLVWSVSHFCANVSINSINSQF